MDHQNWYYTLSAIVQVAAAIVGVGGAVVFFKLSSLEKLLNDFRDRLIKGVLTPASDKTSASYYIYYKDNDLVAEYTKLKSDIFDTNGFVKERKVVDTIIADFEDAHHSEEWVRATFSTFLSLLNSKVFLRWYFVLILTSLMFIIVSALFLLSFINPTISFAVPLFQLIIRISLILLILTGYWFWKIITRELIDVWTLEPKKK